MGRLPFDPDRMKAARPPAPAPRPDAPAAMSVSAFARLIERTVAEAFPKKVTVRGEVSGTRHRTHFYFNLKDENAVISAVMFASAAKRATVTPTDGRTVLATGKLEYYAPSGRLSLIVDALAEDGQGSLEARFRALCDQFRARGWFDPDAKRPVPSFPRRIAVLTARGSAALHDVLDTAKQRCPAVELLLIDIPVQGERAAPTIARTIRALARNAHSARPLGIDAILLTRGGGSVEDLWCFNDPDLATAIHDCTIPLVAAIGHESDTTIAELVADHRAATPTQATVRLTPDRDALDRQLASLDTRRTRSLAQRLAAERRHIAALAARPIMDNPRAIVAIQRERLDAIARELAAAAANRAAAARRAIHAHELRLERHRPHAALARRRDTLDRLARELAASIHARLAEHQREIRGLEGVLRAVDPTAVLERGYSITTRDDGSVLRDPARAAPGERIRTRLAAGTLHSIVEADSADDAGPPPPAPTAAQDAPPQPRNTTPKPTARPAPGTRRTTDDPEPGLFGPDA